MNNNILIDTHVHFDNLAQARMLVEQAHEKGVNYVIAAASDIESSKTAIKIALALQNVKAAAGIHPHEATKQKKRVEGIAKLSGEEAVAAIGECGLDFHYMHSSKEDQLQVFKKQIKLAKAINKPLVIHSRKAMTQTLAILKEESLPEAGCVLHCFSGDINQADEALSLGCLLSFGGVITFKNASAAKVAAAVPLEKIILETDSPYLSPEPFRGKPNSPSNLPIIADKLAKLKGISFEEVAQTTTENAKKLFGLG